MPDVLVALGSNLGDRAHTLDRAVERLAKAPGQTVTACSRWHAMRPIGGPADQGTFLNGAVRLQTSLSPEGVRRLLHETEQALGRTRGARWGPRAIDLDLLLYGAQVVELPELQVPHPRMAFRRFVLEPAAEIAADMRHPLVGWSVGRLLEHLRTSPNYVAIAGPMAAGKTWLANQLQQERAALRVVHENLEAIPLASFYADPAGHAWETEIRFLEHRREQLASGGPDAVCATGGGLLASDYWIDQSLVYASVWLDGEQLARFGPLWHEAASQVIRPRLLVVLDGPDELLWQRIAQRGRPYEQGLKHERLAALRAALERHLALGGHGPLLRLDAAQPEVVVAETLAAIDAMQ